MERDALIAHGTAFLLQDRLMNCSDYSTAWVCRDCGSLISLGYEEQLGGGGVDGMSMGMESTTGGEYCRACRGEEERERGGGAGAGAGGERVSVNVPGGMRVEKRSGGKGQGKGRNMDVIAIPYVFRYVSSWRRCSVSPLLQ